MCACAGVCVCVCVCPHYTCRNVILHPYQVGTAREREIQKERACVCVCLCVCVCVLMMPVAVYHSALDQVGTAIERESER